MLHKHTTRAAQMRAAQECTARARTTPSTHSKGTRSRHTQCDRTAVGRRHIVPRYSLCQPPLARCRRGPVLPAKCTRIQSPSALLQSRPSRAHAHTTTGCCGAPRPSNPRRVCAGRPQGRPRCRHAPARPAECARHQPSSAYPQARPPRARARAPTGLRGAPQPQAPRRCIGPGIGRPCCSAPQGDRAPRNRRAHPMRRRGEHGIGALRTAAASSRAAAPPPHRHLFPSIRSTLFNLVTPSARLAGEEDLTDGCYMLREGDTREIFCLSQGYPEAPAE